MSAKHFIAAAGAALLLSASNAFATDVWYEGATMPFNTYMLLDSMRAEAEQRRVEIERQRHEIESMRQRQINRSYYIPAPTVSSPSGFRRDVTRPSPSTGLSESDLRQMELYEMEAKLKHVRKHLDSIRAYNRAEDQRVVNGFGGCKGEQKCELDWCKAEALRIAEGNEAAGFHSWAELYKKQPTFLAWEGERLCTVYRQRMQRAGRP